MKTKASKACKGFTLIELIIVTALIAVLIVIVLMTINPTEQLKRAQEAGRKVDANELLRAIGRYQATNGKNPNLSPETLSITCSEIVNEEPVAEISDLKNEISDWFPKRILENDKRLFVGILPKSGITKICYQVESASGMKKAAYDGCFVNNKFYLCLPE